MYLTEGWTYLLEVQERDDGDHAFVLVDLSNKEDRRAIRVYDAAFGGIGFAIADDGGEGGKTRHRRVLDAFEYRENAPLFGKHPFFEHAGIRGFADRRCDAATFDNRTEEEIARTKMEIGLIPKVEPGKEG